MSRFNFWRGAGRVTLCLCGCCIILFSLYASSAPSRSLKFLGAPTFVNQGATITVRVEVQAHPDDRILVVGMIDEADITIRSSYIEIRTTSLHVQQFEWQVREAGNFYLVTQLLDYQDKITARQQRELHVINKN